MKPKPHIEAHSVPVKLTGTDGEIFTPTRGGLSAGILQPPCFPPGVLPVRGFFYQ